MALSIKLGLDTEAFKKALKNSVADTKAAQAKLNALSGSLAIKGAAASAAFAGVGVAVGKLVGAYAVQEQAEKKLEQALISTGAATSISLEEMKKYASQLQENSTFGDEATLSAQALLLNIGGPFAKQTLKDATLAMQNLAAATGRDMSAAAQQLGVALADPAKGLSRLERVGVILSAQEKERLKTLQEMGNMEAARAILIGKVNKQFEGQAALTATGTGVFKQLSNTFGDLQEVLGQKLLPELASVATALKNFVGNIQSDERVVNNIVTAIKVFATVTGGLAAVFLSTAAVTKTMAIALGGYNAIVGISTGLMNVLSGAMKLFGKSAGGAKLAVRGLLGATGIGLLITFLPEIIDLVKFFWKHFGSITEIAVKRLGPIFSKFGKLIAAALNPKNWFKGNAIKQAMAEIKDELKGTFDDLAKIPEMEAKKQAEADKKRKEANEKKKKQAEANSAANKEREAQEAALRREQAVIDNATELEEKQAHYDALMELDIADDETRKEWEAERDEFRKGKKATSDKELREIAMKGLRSEDKAERERAKQALKILQDRKKKDDEYAAIKVDSVKRLGGALVNFLGQNSKEGFRISQALQLSEVWMNTKAAVMKAYNASPLTFGMPWSAVIGAAGAFNAAAIARQKPPGAQMGGIVPRQFGTPAKGDHQLMMLEAGEKITPGRDVEDDRRANRLILERLGNLESGEGEERETNVTVGFTGEYSDILEAETIEHQALGIGTVR